MVISNVVGHNFAFLLPVGLVIVCVVLVYAFGFKSSVPPNFKQLSLSSDEKKLLKKRKLKEKKAQTNGHATVIIDENEGKKPLKQSSKADTNKVKRDEAKKENQKSPAKAEKKAKKGSGKENQEPPTPKKKKNEKIIEDKPSDFDEGEWETAFSRKEKKNRKKEDEMNISTPEKTPKKKVEDKKSPKPDKAAENVKPLSPKKSNQQNKVVPSSPEGKKQPTPAAKPAPATKPAPKASPQKIEVKVEAPEEKVFSAEPKSQRSTPKQKKQTGNPSSNFINAEMESNVKNTGSGDNEADSNEIDDQWKEAPQKKSKKKVRKD